jgi:cytochrome c553
MKKVIGVLVIGFACAVLGSALLNAAGLPLWAYGYWDKATVGDYTHKCTAVRPFDCARGGTPPDDGRKRTLPGGTGEWTVTEIANDYGPVDWYPSDHPKMPDIVARGRQKDGIRACGLCHYPNGQGKPENAPVAGTSVSYIMQQMADFKSGVRHSADPNKANAFEMNAMAAALTDKETREAADYFAAIKYKPWIKVVEVTQIPKVAAGVNGLFMPVKDGGMVPLGKRLIETPVNPDETGNLRNPRSGMIAYVPPGTLAKGEVLATKGGNGRTLECTQCHGTDLRGLGPVPAIAGRPASYLARQLYDMQVGARHGEWGALMKPVVQKLTEDDILALSAYAASRQP